MLWNLIGGVGLGCLALSIGSSIQLHGQSPSAGQAPGEPQEAYSQGWNLESFPPAKATLTATNDISKVRVSAIDGTKWHVQVYQGSFQVNNGSHYRLKFRAKADPARSVQVYASMSNGDYHHVGLDSNVYLTPIWHTYDFSFKASKVGDASVRLPALQLGNQTGSVWVSDVVLETERRS